MKQKTKQKIFYLSSAFLALSFISSYLNTGSSVTNINGVNINPNVLNFEIEKLKTNIPNYSNGYVYLYQQKEKIIKDMRKEDIYIPKEFINEEIKTQYEFLFQKELTSFENFRISLLNKYDITPRQFQDSIENDLYFNFFANSLEISNLNTTENDEILKEIIAKKITIKNKGNGIKQELTYIDNKKMFLDSLLISYKNNEKLNNENKNKELSITNNKIDYIITKIEILDTKKVDESFINDITNKSIINYYF